MSNRSPTVLHIVIPLALTWIASTELSAQTDELVLFHSIRDDHSEIYVMDASGAGEVALDAEPDSDEFGPRWSPDGRKILHTSDRGGQSDLWVMNPDGSGKTQLTDSVVGESGARWSADGAYIYFHSFGGVRRIDADGGNQVDVVVDAFSNVRVELEPDGQGLLFVSNRGGDNELYRFALTRGTIEPLTDAEGTSDHPAVSPDGSRIAFYSTRSGVGATWIMNADGSGQTHVLDGFRPDSWSADGERIYGGATATAGRIVSFLPDGSDLIYLSSGSPDYAAHVSPWLFVDGFESGDESAWN